MSIEAISPDGRLVKFDANGHFVKLSSVVLFSDGMRRLGYMQTGRDKYYHHW